MSEEDPALARCGTNPPKTERTAAFLADLRAIEQKHHARVGGCGCCGSPWVMFEGGKDDQDKIDEVDVNPAKLVPSPLPILLDCPLCKRTHIDQGEWATKPHRKHLCAGCGHTWRPSPFPTRGVSLAEYGRIMKVNP
jgi:hypothetical protein